jgi:UDP-glucose:glycoprotein glucosyltransferase
LISDPPLPQEWLWCESWCTNASKPAAKAIDLCNNPLYKTPKLTMAREFVEEWSRYDEEVAELSSKLVK